MSVCTISLLFISNSHGVYSFCMCPGGFVVNASSENNHLAVNGMSNYKRDEENVSSFDRWFNIT